MNATPFPRPRVLFLCTGNACRSQMAEGWARHLLGERLEAYSAGVAPAGVDQRAVTAMAEVGIDLSNHRSKHVDELLEDGIDLVITVCDNAREGCPVFPGSARVIHPRFRDPAAATGDEESVALVFGRVRDEIGAFVRTELPAILEPDLHP